MEIQSPVLLTASQVRLCPNVAVQWIALLLCVPEFLGSNLDPEMDNREWDFSWLFCPFLAVLSGNVVKNVNEDGQGSKTCHRCTGGPRLCFVAQEGISVSVSCFTRTCQAIAKQRPHVTSLC
jgi:hypothetical protein